jgi:hypothetical protein
VFRRGGGDDDAWLRVDDAGSRPGPNAVEAIVIQGEHGVHAMLYPPEVHPDMRWTLGSPFPDLIERAPHAIFYIQQAVSWLSQQGYRREDERTSGGS